MVFVCFFFLEMTADPLRPQASVLYLANFVSVMFFYLSEQNLTCCSSDGVVAYGARLCFGQNPSSFHIVLGDELFNTTDILKFDL